MKWSMVKHAAELGEQGYHHAAACVLEIAARQFHSESGKTLAEFAIRLKMESCCECNHMKPSHYVTCSLTRSNNPC